ncbi:MAG: TetR/AcrR family transcriptional regulator [Acidimicrobiales bacterium]
MDVAVIALDRPTGVTDNHILDTALVLVARWGVAKTALSDLAREAGCSRATLYRAFPGGKQQLFEALGQRELCTYLATIVAAIDDADNLENALTDALAVAAQSLRDHRAAQFVLDYEPGLVLPFLGFQQVDVLYRHAAASIGPHLERFLPAHRAAWAAEWAARLLLTYLFHPDGDDGLANRDHTRHLVVTFVLPSFAADLHPTPTAGNATKETRHDHHRHVLQ